ncbi:MAG: TIGR04282 family arsenosugar biosynthesis glycosyltransferase [Desulfuromonadaceae bacterium]
MKRGLIVFAREPLPGAVKSRLAASIGDQAAADLYETMLEDVLKGVRQLDDVAHVVYWACEEESLPRLSEKYRCPSRRQIPGDLGQRMRGAFGEMFADGSDVCCIIGSDAPDLPLPYIREACRLLETERADVVLGPSRDGGYYLIGMRQVWPQFFTDIPWGSASVLELSLEAARNAGLTAALLPEWQDIDTVEDLRAFQERNRVTTMETT